VRAAGAAVAKYSDRAWVADTPTLTLIHSNTLQARSSSPVAIISLNLNSPQPPLPIPPDLHAPPFCSSPLVDYAPRHSTEFAHIPPADKDTPHHQRSQQCLLPTLNSLPQPSAATHLHAVPPPIRTSGPWRGSRCHLLRIPKRRWSVGRCDLCDQSRRKPGQGIFEQPIPSIRSINHISCRRSSFEPGS
jgi:hypothetical protein